MNVTALLFHVRGQALHILDDAASLYGLHLRKLDLGPLRSAAAQMALAAFRAHEFTRTRQAKSL